MMENKKNRFRFLFPPKNQKSTWSIKFVTWKASNRAWLILANKSLRAKFEGMRENKKHRFWSLVPKKSQISNWSIKFVTWKASIRAWLLLANKSLTISVVDWNERLTIASSWSHAAKPYVVKIFFQPANWQIYNLCRYR